MAVKTSAATGNLSDGATWVGGVAPADDDDIIIATGHTITVSANKTLGGSRAQASDWGSARDFAAEPPAVEIQGTGSLVIAADVTFTVRGDIDVDAIATKDITMNAGSVLAIDSSAAAAPTTTQYKINCIRLTVTGTSWAAGDFCLLDGNPTGNGMNAVFQGASGGVNANRSNINATYLRVTRFGSASVDGILLNGRDEAHSLVHVEFDGNGRIDIATAIAAGQNFTWQYVTFKNSLHATNSCETVSVVAPTTGTRLFQSIVFDKPPAFIALPGTDIDNMILLSGLVIATGTSEWGDVKNSLIRWGNSGGSLLNSQDIHDNFFYNDGTSAAHGIKPLAAGTANDIHDNVFEWVYPLAAGNGSGDLIFPQNGAGGTCTIQGNISVPNAVQDSTGDLVSMGSNTNLNCKIFHNTVPSTSATGEGSLLHVAETSLPIAGAVSEVKSNLIYTPTGRTPGVKAVRMDNATIVQDIITPSGWDYNWGFGLAAGSEGNGFHDNEVGAGDMFSTVPTDSNGGTGDPQFVNVLGKMATWDLSLGGDGTAANALVEMGKLNDTDFDTNYTVANLLAYIRGCFAVQNPSLRNAGHDGETIGAGEFVITVRSFALLGVGA